MIAAAALAQRYWKKDLGSIVALQLVIAGVAFASTTRVRRIELLTGTLTQFLILLLIVASYFVALILVARYSMGKMGYGKVEWDAREVLFLVPLAELASVSVSAAALPLSGYYSQLGMLLLLVPVILTYRKQVNWANASFLSMLVLLGFTGTIAKVHTPYSWNSGWNSAPARPMFMNRHWYRHPIYGAMYLDGDLWQFSKSICTEIDQGKSRPELLSLPFSYPNYFCDISPWHGYVQTFFDITARSTIEKMIGELRTAPPEWIVYQREMSSMSVQEQTFIHGQPFAQRDLDGLIMQRIATGQWRLVNRRTDKTGDGWYIIRTRP
jgi:hypothetical protein